MSKHQAMLLAVLGLAVAALGGCTSPAEGNAGGTATATASRSPSPSASASASMRPAGSPGGISECRDADVLVASANGGAATGHQALLVTFVNESGHTCYLQGFPTVSLVDASGMVLLNAQDTLNGFIGGAVANGDSGLTAPPRVVLVPIRSVEAVLEWDDVNPIQGVPGGCRVPRSAAILVTPPGSTRVSRLAGVTYVCDGFQINPVIDKSPS